MENKTLNLINKIIVGVIAVVGTILYFMIMKDPDNADGIIDTILNFTYFVLAFAVIVSVWVWFKEMLSHPEKLKQTAIVTVIFLAIVLFSKYVLASNQPAHYYPNINVDATTSNWVDTGLYTFYILGTIAVLLMFLSPVLSMIGGGNGSSNDEEQEEYEEGMEVAE
jgi:uncharacterized membrane protein